MIRPIQFRRNKKINLNLLKFEVDRRVDLITQMIKGKNIAKSYSELCCKVQDKFCQTQQPPVPLSELTNLPLISMESLKPRPKIKRLCCEQNKQNEITTRSTTSILNKNKKTLNSIQQSEHEALKTSRYNKKLESQAKKTKDTQTNKSNKQIDQRKTQKNCLGDSYADVLNSYESNKKVNLSTKRKFNSYFKQYSAQDSFLNLSLNSSIPNGSDCKSIVNRRKDSINDSSHINDSSRVLRNNKKLNQSFPTNFFSTSFQGAHSLEQPSNTGHKRIAVGSQVCFKILSQIQSKVQGKVSKKVKQPIINNIRISLLKRLEDKHLKSKGVTN